MPHRKDTAVKSMKPAEPQAPIDRVVTQAKLTELRATHHPMLLLGKSSDPAVAPLSLR